MVTGIRILFLKSQDGDTAWMDRGLQLLQVPFTLREATARAEFLKELKDFVPDVILADSLTDMSGVEAFQLLKQNNGIGIPYVLCTTSLTEDFAQQCFREGVIDFILKTEENALRLVPVIMNAWRQRHLETEKAEAVLLLKKRSEDFENSFKNITHKINQVAEKKMVSLMKEVDALLVELGRSKKYGRI